MALELAKQILKILSWKLMLWYSSAHFTGKAESPFARFCMREVEEMGLDPTVCCSGVIVLAFSGPECGPRGGGGRARSGGAAGGGLGQGGGPC